ncbi:unnamed protein product [Pedinophyceae sp. YPF-701]|nr:unnamed protein product [Pedinophyceae sp. YPF-701]
MGAPQVLSVPQNARADPVRSPKVQRPAGLVDVDVADLELYTSNRQLRAWLKQMIALCEPEKLYFCDGSQRQWDALTEFMCQSGTLIRLNEQLRPNSFLARSDPADVARVEERTFICSKDKADAGPTNNWKDPGEMKQKLTKLFKGCMKGRTMYVIPFSMGPVGSPMARYGVELSDTPYVAINMQIMTRMGARVLDALPADGTFVPCLHSVGRPLQPGEKDARWPCNPENTYIAHFPEENSVWSFGSGYGGNALLAKKCFALRLASVIGRRQGWLACHMLITKATPPGEDSEPVYLAAAFPSQCGKTNLAMLNSAIPGWKFETLGDDIAWMRFGEDGRLYAINPENGFFGVAPGTGAKTNPNALATCARDTIFTNVALTEDGDVWWEGLTDTPPDRLIDWKGEEWTPDCGRVSSHPNSRFTASAANCPVLEQHDFELGGGVPISAIIFGGRRESTVPLVHEAETWAHGVFMGASVSSETTAAAAGKVGTLRHDPFAMLPFCGHHMGDHFQHWLDLAEGRDPAKLPKMFYVNWFRKSEPDAATGKRKFLWPGFGDNSRVIAWMVDRCQGRVGAKQTAIGLMPREGDLNMDGLNMSAEDFAKCVRVDANEYLPNLAELRQYFAKYGDKLPAELIERIDIIEARLRSEGEAADDN